MSATTATQRGFSLVELMISMTLGLLLLGMLISTYLAAKQTYVVEDDWARMQENARLALRIISRDVRMAGYWGGAVQRWSLHESTDQPLGIVKGECHPGWAHAPALPADDEVLPALNGSDDTRGLFAGCIEASAHIVGTDILSVHFVAANPIADNAIEAGKVYLRSNLLGGLLFKAKTDKALPADFTIGSTARNYRVLATAYYLRPWSSLAPGKSNPAGDHIPTLMRATLGDCGAHACVRHEALIEGIANLQIQYDIDQGNGVHDTVNAATLGDITTTAGKAQWRRVRAVRIGVLARGFIPEAGFVDRNAPYRLGNKSINVDAGYRYFWLTSTVALRNAND